VGDTFKHAKQLVKAVDWSSSPASKYWLDGTTYVPLDEASWMAIDAGQAKL